MSEQSASVELVRREVSDALERPLPPMNDGEVAGAWRTAKALSESGLFPDVKSAGQAFAKMLAGRDLGLTPYESMDALDVIEGSIVASANLHATKVRQRAGYDFRVVWLKIEGEWDGKPNARGQLIPPTVVGVASAEEDAADLREVYGCAIEFLVDGERRGVSRWTLEDSRTSGLLERKGPKGGEGMHKRYPRSMYFARAMSLGVSLHVPEVMRGLRVYVPEDFAGRRESGEDLGAGDATSPASMDTLPTAVEAVLARARALGHAGLANREAAVTALRGRPSEDVGRWIATATKVLNRYAAGRPEPEPEPPDAEVVRCGEADPHREGVVCELDPGHEGAHLGADQTWDRYLEPCGVEFGAGEDGDPRPARCELPKGHDGQHIGPIIDAASDSGTSNEGAESAQAQNEPVSAPEMAETPTTTPEATDGAEAQREPHEPQESPEVVDAEPVHAPEHAEEHTAALEHRSEQLRERLESAKAAANPEEVDAIAAELDAVELELDAATNPNQGSLGV